MYDIIYMWSIGDFTKRFACKWACCCKSKCSIEPEPKKNISYV